MPEQYDPFSPQRIDEALAQLSSVGPAESSSPGPHHADPPVRLVQDLQELYGPERRSYEQALQRVENRLLQQHVRTAMEPTKAEHEHQPIAFIPIQQEGLQNMEKKHVSPAKRSLGRLLGLAAAVIVVVALVGSMAILLENAHHSTITGSGPARSTPTPPGKRPTPLPTPAPQNSANQGHIVYTAPTGAVYALAWSPDSKRVAMGAMNNNGQSFSVQIWDATTGKHPLTLPDIEALTLSWSPDGRYLAVGSGQVQIFDASTGALIRTFSPSIASSGSVASPYLSAQLPGSGGNMVYSTVWSPDGKLMASAFNGSGYGNVVVVWNPNNGQVIYTFHGQSSREVGSLSWSPDSKYVASAGYDGTTQVFNARTGQVIFNHQSGETATAWSPDGKALALVGTSQTVEVWDVFANKKIASNTAPANQTLAWSPDSKEIATGSGSNVVIFNAATGKTLYTFSHHTSYARSLAWSPDGRYIVSGSNGTEASLKAEVIVWVA